MIDMKSLNVAATEEDHRDEKEEKKKNENVKNDASESLDEFTTLLVHDEECRV